MARRLNRHKLQPEIEIWIADGTIQQAQGDAILARYPAGDGLGRMMAILIAVGAVLIVGGLALVISSNWADIPPLAKLFGLLALLAGSTIVGVEFKSRGAARGWWEGAFLVASVLPLLGLAMISQIFHVAGKATGLMLAWTILIVLVPWLTRSVASFVVFLVAGLCLQQAWLSDYVRPHLDVDGRLPDAFQLYTVGAASFGFLCAVLSHRWIRLGERTQARVGEYFGLIVFFGGLYFYGMSVGRHQPWELVWLGVFILALLMVYRATRLGDRTHQINLGLVFVGLVIVSTYLRLVGTMMKTGVVFLSTGGLILGCAYALARWRRHLVSIQPEAKP